MEYAKGHKQVLLRANRTKMKNLKIEPSKTGFKVYVREEIFPKIYRWELMTECSKEALPRLVDAYYSEARNTPRIDDRTNLNTLLTRRGL